METKQPPLIKGRAEVVVAAVVVVVSIATGSAVLAQALSDKPSTPSVAEKPAVMDNKGMDADGSGMNGMKGMGMMGMMSGMHQMKCCGPGTGRADRGAGEKQDGMK